MNPFRAVVVSAVLALAAAPALGGSPNPKDLVPSPKELSKARELVRLLGSKVYVERQRASAELAGMGRLAKQALAEAIADPDPEIRSLASVLLPKADAADLKARCDTFMADIEGKFEHDLPGLKTFRMRFGGSEWGKSRTLYARMIESPYNSSMFAAMDRGETEGGRAIRDRRHAMWWNDEQKRPCPPDGGQVQPRQPTLADIAALLFAESVVSTTNIIPNNDPRDPLSRVYNPFNVPCGITFLTDQESIQALQDGLAESNAYRAIVRLFLATRTHETDLSLIAPYLGHAPFAQFPEAAALARRVISTKGVYGFSKGMALNLIVEQGGRKEIPYLEALLNDETTITPTYFANPDDQPVVHLCLMKDVALAFLITLQGENLKDFGFENSRGEINPDLKVLGIVGNVFTSEEKRTAAFEKWRAKQLRFPAP